ncbi:hypothetical protein ANN_13710 [Periplaneta americana]|uniref:Reverse transcriptase domain-containing protein n=1 Tax=Periplaneta americana TaxID=6978 RepID=A0ABQ8SUF2_PERAM|nr:hypothetical protein ANN_13710 [Periplaneta americana]
MLEKTPENHNLLISPSGIRTHAQLHPGIRDQYLNSELRRYPLCMISVGRRPVNGWPIFWRKNKPCARSKGRIPRHTSLNDIIKRSLTSCGIPSPLEPPGISRADGKRPDGLTLMPWSREKSLIWDSTCVDTLAPSHLPNTSRRAASAAELSEKNSLRRRGSNSDAWFYVPSALITELRRIQATVPDRMFEGGGFGPVLWIELNMPLGKFRITDRVWNWLHQLLIYVDDMNMLGKNPQMIRENTEILLEASEDIGLEVNLEKTKYMIMSRDQNIPLNGNIKIGNLSFEDVEKFKYLGATVTTINDTREEIQLRINMGNACYYSVEKLFSSRLLSKNLKVRIYKAVILPVVLYGCETWTPTLREEQKLRVFENKVLRKIFEG